jgi:hypothetical protein
METPVEFIPPFRRLDEKRSQSAADVNTSHCERVLKIPRRD